MDGWLRFPERCSTTVVVGPRGDKREDACGKPAVAVAIYDGDEAEPHTYAVCKHHARGRTMMPLTSIIETVRTDVAPR